MIETTVFISLGANLGSPYHTLEQAWQDVLALSGVEAGICSSFYRSRPLDERDGPDYCNAVAAIETTLDAPELLKQLQGIENNHGRKRSDDKWASRSLDIDILLFGDEKIDTPLLTVPHYDMHRRDFVVIPLLEIAPYVVVPGHGSVQQLATELKSKLEVWMTDGVGKG